MAMGELQPSFSVLGEDEENLIAATKDIVKAFESNKNLTSDTRKILRDLSVRLYNVAVESEDKEDTSEIKELLNKFEETIMKWEVDQSVILWDCGHDQAHEYLNAVDLTRKLIGRLESLNLCKGNEENELLLKKAHDMLKIGMVRLEGEFKHLIVRNRVPFEPNRTSFSDDSVDFRSSFGDDSVHFRSSFRDDDSVEHDHNIALVNQDVIPWLRTIAKLMFDSNYGRECSRAYVSARKISHDDCLSILEVEKYSIDDVLKMEWNTLNSKIRKWIRAVEIFVRAYLISEKWLSDEIFKDLDTTTTTDCFLESTKTPLLQLLKSCNIEKLIRIQDPEKLIPIIDIYEVLADIVRDISLLYSSTENASSSCIQMESQDILRKLRDCVKATIFKFQNAVSSARKPTNIPSNPGIYYLTRYVMNYLKGLSSYTKTLDMVLMNEEESSVSLQFKSLVLILETNLDDMSKLYENDALRHIFLLNNVHYIADKVKCSQELRNLLGDDWIRERNREFQQHAMSYERASWSSILKLLNPGSNSISRTSFKDRLQGFYLAFEELYKIQTGWMIPDDQLREDLKISTSQKVIRAYRTFVVTTRLEKHGRTVRFPEILGVSGRVGTFVGRSYFVSENISFKKNIKIKYSAEELENLLLDLFEGSQKSL